MANLFKTVAPLSLAVNYHHIGCFKDNASRAMSKLLGNWRHGSKAIEKCALATEKAGYSVFGVQFAGECWSGPQAYMTYKKYGTSNRCVNGRGGSWVQDVYEIVSKWCWVTSHSLEECVFQTAWTKLSLWTSLPLMLLKSLMWDARTKWEILISVEKRSNNNFTHVTIL